VANHCKRERRIDVGTGLSYWHRSAGENAEKFRITRKRPAHFMETEGSSKRVGKFLFAACRFGRRGEKSELEREDWGKTMKSHLIRRNCDKVAIQKIIKERVKGQ